MQMIYDQTLIYFTRAKITSCDSFSCFLSLLRHFFLTNYTCTGAQTADQYTPQCQSYCTQACTLLYTLVLQVEVAHLLGCLMGHRL